MNKSENATFTYTMCTPFRCSLLANVASACTCTHSLPHNCTHWLAKNLFLSYLLKKELRDVLLKLEPELELELESLADDLRLWLELLWVMEEVGGALSDCDGCSGGVALLLVLLSKGLSLPLLLLIW